MAKGFGGYFSISPKSTPNFFIEIIEIIEIVFANQRGNPPKNHHTF
ncbi:MAG: hypothetical protein MJ002_03475 [Paludibacteraceae bacterium]|nr:hypothetical protein [Paludibacteraceae bacterium]